MDSLNLVCTKEFQQELWQTMIDKIAERVGIETFETDCLGLIGATLDTQVSFLMHLYDKYLPSLKEDAKANLLKAVNGR